MIDAVLSHWDSVLLWGGIATVAMTTLMEGAQQGGLSRMSLPFLFGSAVTGQRRAALLLGFVLYGIGGLLFAFVYAAVFESLGRADIWLGLGMGAAHGVFLLVVFLPLMARLHPRIASEHDGPSALRRIEPPGVLGLHYGRQTPLVTMAGQMLYGLVLGTFYPL